MTAVGPDGRPTGQWLIEGEGRPDLDTVDRIARGALAVTRAGGKLRLDDMAPDLLELLELVALPILADGIVEVRGQPEGGE
jgi:hypothetical protein